MKSKLTYTAEESRAMLAKSREDYKSPKGHASWWQKDGAWHIALPGVDMFGKQSFLWTADTYDSREEAIAAIEATPAEPAPSVESVQPSPEGVAFVPPFRWSGTKARPQSASYLYDGNGEQVGCCLDGFTDDPNFAEFMLSALNSHAAHLAKIQALTEVAHQTAMLAADLACYCQDIERNLRSGAGILDLKEKAVRINEAARAALALP